MWRKLKLADLENGRYNLKRDDIPLANLGFQATAVSADYKDDDSPPVIVGDSKIIPL